MLKRRNAMGQLSVGTAKNLLKGSRDDGKSKQVEPTTAPSPRTSEPEIIKALQGVIGNSAVAGMVSSSQEVHDSPSMESFDFTGKVGLVANLTHEHDRAFGKIMEAFYKFREATQDEKQIKYLQEVVNQTEEWLDNYDEKYKGSNKVADAKKILVLSRAELKSKVEKVSEDRYLKKMKKGEFKYVTFSGQSSHNHNAEEQKFAKEKNLSKAELTAIKVYTAGDYDYINPTMEKNEGWLESKMKKLASPNKKVVNGEEHNFPAEWSQKGFKDQMIQQGPSENQKKEIQEEGKAHGEMAKKGLEKLESTKSNPVYRGMALPRQDILKNYAEGKTVGYKAFTSTSDDREKALSFAKDNVDQEKVGVLFTIKQSNGKDVSQFSSVKSEKEILLLPGATLAVDKVIPPSKEHNYYQIKLVQTS